MDMFDIQDKLELKKSLADINSKIGEIKTVINSVGSDDSKSRSTNSTVSQLYLNDRLKRIEQALTKIDFQRTNKNEISLLSRSVEDLQNIIINSVCPTVSQMGGGFGDLSFLFGNLVDAVNSSNSKLCELNANIINNTELQSSTSEKVIKELNNIYNVMMSIQQSGNEPDTIEYSSVLISYPTAGNTSGLMNVSGAGNTIFNFINGKVTDINGTEHDMSDAAENYGTTGIKSFTIFTDRPVDLSISGVKSWVVSIPAGSFRLTKILVDRVTVHTYDETNLWISGSMTHDGAPNASVSSLSSGGLPNTLIVGSKIDISSTATKITTTATKIEKVVTVQALSMGGGTYIALGNSSSQPHKLFAIGDTHDIDFIDDLSKVYVKTDGTNAQVGWFGG